MWTILASVGTWIGGSVVKLITGGSLETILGTVNKYFDAETTREEIKAEIVKTYINNQAQIVLQRTWWFQLFFVIPLGFWWTAVIIDSVFHLNLRVAALPPPLDSWAGGIISALFVVDSTKSVVQTFFGSRK